MPKKKTEEVIKRVQSVPKEETKEPEIIITSITINPNGTIFGLANNVIYVYDNAMRTWGKA
jgi:hypothetical protein